MTDIKIGDTIITDHGAAIAAAFRVSEDDLEQVGFLIARRMVWADVDYVEVLKA